MKKHKDLPILHGEFYRWSRETMRTFDALSSMLLPLVRGTCADMEMPSNDDEYPNVEFREHIQSCLYIIIQSLCENRMLTANFYFKYKEYIESGRFPPDTYKSYDALHALVIDTENVIHEVHRRCCNYQFERGFFFDYWLSEAERNFLFSKSSHKEVE